MWNVTLGTAKDQWLRQTLESSHAQWGLIFIHRLVGSLDCSGHGDAEVAKLYEWGGNNAHGSFGVATQRPRWAMPIHQLLVQNKVTAGFH